MAKLYDLQICYEYQLIALVLKIPKRCGINLKPNPFLTYKRFCGSHQESEFCKNARNSSNFKRSLWQNYMTYSFVTNTSGLLWFSGFQKGAALICSLNRFWFINVFVTFTKNFYFAQKQVQENCQTLNWNYCKSIWPTAWFRIPTGSSFS